MTKIKTLKCPSCGAPIKSDEKICSYCGCAIEIEDEETRKTTAQKDLSYEDRQKIFVGSVPSAEDVFNFGTGKNDGDGSAAATNESGFHSFCSERRLIAILLAFLLGGIGAQFFYLHKFVSGMFCVIFCMFGIPAVVGWIHGIILCAMGDKEFVSKYPR